MAVATAQAPVMGSVTETVQTSGPQETLHVKLTSKAAISPHPPNMPKPKTKLRLDPQRALEPARKKLSTVEAQRIMAVLVESIRRTDIVSILPFIIENLSRYKVVLGSELVQLLEEHKAGIESFEELRAEAERLLHKEHQASLKKDAEEEEEEEEYMEYDNRVGSGNRSSSRGSSRPSSGVSISSQADNAMRNLAHVAKQMQDTTKKILRAFYINPAAATTILKEHSEAKSSEAKELVMELNELKEIIMGMLLTSPMEEMERNHYLREISERERYNASIIQKLEMDLQVAVNDKDNEIRKKNDVIRRLQADLHQIEKFSDEHIRRTKSEAEKQEAADLKNSEGKRGKLTQEITQLRSQLQNLIVEHRENEHTFRTRKFKIETEVENWIQKYDQDMGERQAKFEVIDTDYTEEKKQLNELEERFKTLEEEYNQIMEERRIAKERQDAAERELAMAVGAATCIQAFWRSYKVRKALKSKKKKKGGGKKKGKK